MKILSIAKDGGEKSRVWGLFLIEWKRFFSVAFLWFQHGSRKAYHSHAFNAKSWLLWGKLTEHNKDTGEITTYKPSWRSIKTPREMYHKVESTKNSIVFTLRGPWVKKWKEYDEFSKEEYDLSSGRVKHQNADR